MNQLIAVVTIPATSSELNIIAVVTNDEINRKGGVVSPLLRPKVTILDPELTYTIPMKQTAYSAADIMSHLMECSLSHTLAWAPFQERYAYSSIRTIRDCMDRIFEGPGDKEARAQFMWTASFAWCGFYENGLGPCQMTIHTLGHSMSNLFDTPHGASMSVTMLAMLKYYLKERTKRYADFAREALEVVEEDDLKAATKGIETLDKWFKKIGTPTTLAEAGIPDEAIEKLTADAHKSAVEFNQGDIYTMDVIRDLFNLCK